MGACSLAPVVVVDEETHGRMTPEAAWTVVDALKNEEEPA